MAQQSFSPARLRRIPQRATVAACALIAPLLGGCVSAVDESQSFGFAPTASSTSTAVPGEAGAAPAGGDDAAAADVASTPTASEDTPGNDRDAARIAEAAKTGAATKVAETRTADAASPPGETAGGIPPTALLTRTSAPAVAAFATPGGERGEAGKSLYASLYNQSEAKTPLRNAEAGKSQRVVVLHTDGTAASATGDALPGVDPKSLFEIGQRASVDSDLLDDIGSDVQMASLSGIARLAPSGLMIQRDDIVTNCFDPALMNMISQIQTRFRKKVIITSGFRSPAHNRRVNGAKASMHMACKAADLHVPGVNGREVAAYVRSLPGRGGVGTYCHTAAIHVDSGKQRDWNWPCRTRRYAAVKATD